MNSQVDCSPKPLLVRIKPYEFESLKSFLYRVSLLNGYSDLGWLKSYNKLPYIKNYGYNYIYQDNIIHYLAKTLGLRPADIRKLTVQYIAENVVGSYQSFPKDAIYAWMRTAHRFCPLCLKEEPYQRIYWLLAPTLTCPIHSVALNYACSFCGEAPSTINLVTGICSCGMHLSNSRSIPIPQNQYLIKNQKDLFSSLGFKDFYKDAYDGNPYNKPSFSFHTYYKLICAIICSLCHNGNHQEYFIDKISSSFDLLIANGKYKSYFFLVAATEFTLSDWPHNFNTFLQCIADYRRDIPPIHDIRWQHMTIWLKDEFMFFITYCIDALYENHATLEDTGLLMSVFKEYFKKTYTYEYFEGRSKSPYIDPVNGKSIAYIIFVSNMFGYKNYDHALELSNTEFFYRGKASDTTNLRMEGFYLEDIVSLLFDCIFSNNSKVFLPPINGGYPHTYIRWITFGDAKEIHPMPLLIKGIRDGKFSSIGICPNEPGLSSICLLMEEVEKLTQNE